MEKATFAMGCFWEPDLLFSQIPGVIKATVGYTGGHTENPTYEEVCSGKTGHAEAVEVIFNPEIVSYEKLLDTFWNHHNPTTLNQQGPDHGEQYRSACFYHNDLQKELILASKAKLEKEKRWKNPIVTEITEVSAFYPAEDYHQDYLKKRGITTCHI